MIHIAIVEDNAQDLLSLKRCLEYVQEKENVQFLFDEFLDGMKFISNYTPTYDLVLMDIEMPNMNGIEAARKLREIDRCVLLIFITNMAQYAISGYEVDAMDYILKPLNKYSFLLKFSRALGRISANNANTLTIKCDGELTTIQIQYIKYIEVEGHYVIYHTNEGIFKEYQTLKYVLKLLDSKQFISCNRCYVVNCKYIESIKKNVVVVNGEELIISRPQKKKFILDYTNYLGGR